MSRPAYRVRLLVAPTQEQLRDAAQVLVKAFITDPLMDSTLGERAGDEQFFFGLELGSVTGCSESGELWVAELVGSQDEDGKIVGVACWYGPGQSQSLNPEATERWERISATFSPALRDWWNNCFISGRTKQADEQLGKDTKLNNWYLHILGVMPGYHNQGIGHTLFNAVKDKAVPAGKSICIEASNEKNLAMYKKWGCKDMGSEQYDSPFSSGFRLWMLLMSPPEAA